jgi:hypothetical protein
MLTFEKAPPSQYITKAVAAGISSSRRRRRSRSRRSRRSYRNR